MEIDPGESANGETTNSPFPRIECSTFVAQGQVLEVRLSNFLVHSIKEKSSQTIAVLHKGTASSNGTKDKIELSLWGKITPCYSSEKNQWECLIGIPADAVTGKQKIGILKNGKMLASKEVEILSTFYPTEPLYLSEATKSLLSKKGREKEIKKIRKSMAQATLSKEKFWDTNPQMPLEGKMESLYGERRILDGVLRPGFHRGVDIGAALGTPILAMQDGKVLLAEEFSQEGKMVMLNHGQGVASVYLHLSEILVKPKKMVKKGEVIGKVGSTGVSNSPHLHWGVYIHSIPVDPLFFLK